MQAAKDAGLEKARTYKLRLAVDEIATNIINYGYQRAGLEGDITVRSVLDDNSLTIILDDVSGIYDPTLRTPPPPEFFTQPIEERAIGGWGVYLAIQSVDQFYYERLQDHNLNIFIMYRATHGNLLLISSSQNSSSAAAQYLVDLGYSVTCIEGGQPAVDRMRQEQVELVLLELPLPEQDAQGFIKGLKADNALRNIPLLILADPGKVDDFEDYLKSGAEDYITQPINEIVLKKRIRSALERQRLRKAEWLLAAEQNIDTN